MAYVNLPPAPPVTPVSYVARAPAPAKPPAHTEPRPAPASGGSHGPAVILGGAFAGAARPPVRQAPEPPKPAHHIDRVI